MKLATRGSRLALAQTAMVADLIRKAAPEVTVEVVRVKTQGDTLSPERLSQVDAKSAFTKEIEKEVLAGNADCAVHSMKDLPVALEPGLTVVATPPRGDARDAFVSDSGLKLSEFPGAPRIGTSSVRRRAQLGRIRKDAVMVDLHGNVETRLKRATEQGLDGAVLAAAGLQRLGLEGRITQTFEPIELIPAPCQGTIAVEARLDDEETIGVLKLIDDSDARATSECERAFSAQLGGDCYVPLGAFATVEGETVEVIGMVANEDGSRWASSRASGKKSEAASTGRRLAELLEKSGGRSILEGIAR